MSGVVLLDVADPALVIGAGPRVTVAVVDSGIAPGHRHVGGVASGLRIGRDGGEDDDWADRIGHGTAVAAAIREKAPDAALIAIRVFETELATTADTLARAIRRAADLGADFINLSLGTANPGHAEPLTRAVRYAAARGALVVSAREVDGTAWLPGSIDGVIGVRLDWTLPRTAIRVHRGAGGPALAEASGYPRPIPGVDPERNLKGISFAVANVTGVLARAGPSAMAG